MKQKMIVALLALFLISPVQAKKIEERKLHTIKEMYDDAFQLAEFNDTYDGMQSIYKYSNRSFRKNLINARENANYDDGTITRCGQQYYELHLYAGMPLFLSEVFPRDVKYSILEDGDIRVVVKPKEFTPSDIKDYSLECSTNSCQITDIYSHDPFQGDEGYATSNFARYCY